MGNKLDLVFVRRAAERYANRRILAIGKGSPRFKVNQRELHQELEYASILGEMSALERLLTVLQNNPDMDRSDIEAELQLSIVSYNNFVTDHIGSGVKLKLDQYLELRGYHEKGPIEVVPIEPRV